MTRRRVALVHGMYYLASGLWPLVSIRTFELVTGPKRDDWLVRTVGALAAAIGAVLAGRSMLGGGRGASGGPDPALGLASAAAFTAVDVVYVAKGTISPIYLGDAAVELALAAGWVAALLGERREGSKA